MSSSKTTVLRLLSLFLALGLPCCEGTPEPRDPAEAPAHAEPRASQAAQPELPIPSSSESLSEQPGSGSPEGLQPPPLPDLMRRIGYETAGEADLAEFVHVPPGARGESGVFGSGEHQVRVALIEYPNPRYVRPHLSDVQERVRVLPSAREAVLAHERWIVHVMAADLATAELTRSRIAEALFW